MENKIKSNKTRKSQNRDVKNLDRVPKTEKQKKKYKIQNQKKNTKYKIKKKIQNTKSKKQILSLYNYCIM